MKGAAVALFAPVLVVTTMSLAAAQQKPSPTVPPPPPPLPSMPAALTVPNPFGGLVPGPRDLYQNPSGTDRFQHIDRRPRPPVIIGSGGYFPYPYYPDPNYMPGLDHYRRKKEPEVRDVRGGLVLLTTPPSAQVFVDGFYVGLVEEFGASGRPMSIAAGAHRIDLRAPAYDTLSFSVMIEPNDILRYRGDMQLAQPATPPAVAAPAPPAPRAAAKSYYIIPKCYAGDRPPRGALPPGCDRKNLQTYK